MTPHNNAKKNDIAKRVIMAGDPLRVKYIAEKYLKNYKLVNSVRGMYAYTGYYDDKKITVMAHGMGNPSIGIYSYELYKFYDVDEIIRIGSCGSMCKKINLMDIILVEKTYSLSNFAMLLNNDKRKLINSSKYLNEKIISAALENKIKINKSTVYCTDVFYDSIDHEKLYKEKGCAVVEMETFALFSIASMLNKKASCILTVSDSLITKEELTSNQRQTSFDEMIKLALKTK